jgi:hemerythrin-like domain-containing protein
MSTSNGSQRPDGASKKRVAVANPLDVIAHEHELQERMCDALERVADGLPEEFDRRLVADLLPALKRDLTVHVEDEEKGLFPLLRQRAVPEDNLECILAQLCDEHAMDQGYAEEIVVQFDSLNRGASVGNPDMLGYMLRGFFETQRRHLLWETAVLLPLAHARLTAADLKELARVMLDNRRRMQVSARTTLFEVF